MRITVDVSSDQIMAAFQCAINSAPIPRTDFSNAPTRVLAWCEYPAGAEWRDCRRNGSGQWISSGCDQAVKFWIPMPLDPR